MKRKNNIVPFRNPMMKQYEAKPASSILPLLALIGILVFAARFLFGAPVTGQAAMLPHAELTRWFAIGGNETLLLQCVPEENPAHFYCRVERQINGEEVATVVIDEKTAHRAMTHFFKLWPKRNPTQQPARATAEARLSLSWTIEDGERKASGEAVWRDKIQEDRTTAVLSLEGELEAQLSR